MKALLEYLKRTGTTQADLSRRSGVPVQAINDVARGRRAGFGKARAVKIWEATGGSIPLETLLGLNPAKTRAA